MEIILLRHFNELIFRIMGQPYSAIC